VKSGLTICKGAPVAGDGAARKEKTIATIGMTNSSFTIMMTSGFFLIFDITLYFFIVSALAGGIQQEQIYYTIKIG
jgi:hypothetical protein